MYSENFDYFRPSTVEETIEILQNNEGAQILAGGHSLLPAMKLRLTSTSALVDIARIEALKGIKSDQGRFEIGAMTTHAEIARSQLLRDGCAVMADTAANIGDVQVRNRGTIGGSLAHGDPAADFPTVLLALSAVIHARGPEWSREIASGDFCTDMFTTALGPAEVLTGVSVPELVAGQGAVYLKHHHPASRYAVVGVAAVVTLSDGVISQARVAVGGVSAFPVRCTEVEMVLVGKNPSAEVYKEAAGHVPSAIRAPIGDFYASPEFRLHLAEVMTQRALEAAAGKAGA
ncbi:MAG: xanthine dehydrogenase family protein subunit M [Anaerolineales bacterium]|nr:xanthine dehydrogenase family protein subunit M [Anaerolineales bacterium]